MLIPRNIYFITCKFAQIQIYMHKSKFLIAHVQFLIAQMIAIQQRIEMFKGVHPFYVARKGT